MQKKENISTGCYRPRKSGKVREFAKKSQRIRDRIPKVREFCCLKFIFSQAEDPKWSWAHGKAESWSRKGSEFHAVCKVATL